MNKILFCLLFILTCSACAPSAEILATPNALDQTDIASTWTPTTVPSVTNLPTYTTTNTPMVTNTVTLPPSPTPTDPPTHIPTPQPIYVVLRGEVNVEHVSCFYGPHKSYLYKYGLVGGSNLEIIGRMVDTNYIQVRAIGGDNPCWMNLEWMNVRGEIENVQPIDPLDTDIPSSPYYFNAPTGVNVTRDGNQVTLNWNAYSLRAGDGSEQFPYLLEAWVCREGRLIFTPMGSWINSLTIEDQPGCREPSHARLYAVEKHGYTPYIEVPWPTNLN
ncbi:MAG: hypothetical protein CVU39_27795 [Chloroflexi bacterium HGW-Chloroflexi-10]|nr:MAG: hypothetical protein CVU39_27795 [Chloroflexi bacterium HGW-Chloroflexi-10]